MIAAKTVSHHSIPARARGVTFIELLIVMAVFTILTAVAYPSYINYVTRASRVAAEGFMLEVSNRQERFLLDNRGYAANIGTLTASGLVIPGSVSPKYTITVVSPRSGLTTPSYLVSAAPIGKQAVNDQPCGTLTIDETGAKSATGFAGAACWQQ